MSDESTRANVPNASDDQPDTTKTPTADDKIRWFLIRWIPPLLVGTIIASILTGNLAALSGSTAIGVIAVIVYRHYF